MSYRRGSRRIFAYGFLCCVAVLGVTLVLLRSCLAAFEREESLHAAINAGDADKVRQLIREGVDVNATLTDGWRPLTLAAYHNELEIAKILIEAGADVNSGLGLWHPFQGSTPLLYALKNREFVELLLASGADVNARDYYGRTAFMWASALHNTSLVERLMEAGAEVNGADKEGVAPLLYAAGFPPRGFSSRTL